MGMANLNIKYNYPSNPYYDFQTKLVRINLDEERKKDLINGNGFVISPTHGIKKDLKDPDSIFSNRFGNNLSDMNQFVNRFRCECGMLTNSIHLGMKCKVCGTKVKYVPDDPKYTGWLVIQNTTTPDPDTGELVEYYVIHPNLYRAIEFFIGKDFKGIIEYKTTVDEDGHLQEAQKKEDNPFYGIGMTEFQRQFNKIMDYYLAKFPAKKQYYDDIMRNRDKIFIQSIPVFSTILRPFSEDQDAFYYEDSNAIYTKLNKLITELNSNVAKRAYNRKKKSRQQLLYDIQETYMTLYDSIVEILSGKKGAIRSLIAGRYNFTSRDVICSDPTLRADQIKLSYYALTELLQISIINILKKTYNLSYQDAHRIWYKATITPDQRIVRIIESMIKNSCDGQGIPIIINRNPTIQYGSILQVFCVGITFSYTMQLSLQIIVPMNADFDELLLFHAYKNTITPSSTMVTY